MRVWPQLNGGHQTEIELSFFVKCKHSKLGVPGLKSQPNRLPAVGGRLGRALQASCPWYKVRIPETAVGFTPSLPMHFLVLGVEGLGKGGGGKQQGLGHEAGSDLLPPYTGGDPGFVTLTHLACGPAAVWARDAALYKPSRGLHSVGRETIMNKNKIQCLKVVKCCTKIYKAGEEGRERWRRDSEVYKNTCPVLETVKVIKDQQNGSNDQSPEDPMET